MSKTQKCEGIAECFLPASAIQKVEPIAQYAGLRLFASRSKYRNAFVFSPRTLKWYAYDSKGRLVKSGAASGGRNYCPDIRRGCRTPVGSYRVYRKGSASCRSSKYPLPNGGARMPYCTFFKGGYAIHGGHVPNYNASHGCIRVKPHAAKWLHRNFLRHGTRVIVKPY